MYQPNIYNKKYNMGVRNRNYKFISDNLKGDETTRKIDDEVNINSTTIKDLAVELTTGNNKKFIKYKNSFKKRVQNAQTATPPPGVEDNNGMEVYYIYPYNTYLNINPLARCTSSIITSETPNAVKVYFDPIPIPGSQEQMVGIDFDSLNYYNVYMDRNKVNNLLNETSILGFLFHDVCNQHNIDRSGPPFYTFSTPA
jgi:hypothetical protein